MKKALARLTYPLRQQLRTSRGSAHVCGISTDQLEADIRRLESGWRQHIPRILDAISVAENDAKASDDVHARIDALRQDVDRLSARMNASYRDIEKRLAKLEPSNRK